MKPFRLLPILLLACGMTACSNNDDVMEQQIPVGQPVVEVPGNNVVSDSVFQLNAAQQARVTPLNDFSVKLFRQLSSGQGSTVVSPLSVAFVLGMINDGAQGETQQEILSALGFQGDDAQTVNELMKKFIDGAPKADGKVTVAMANNVTLSNDYLLNPNYAQTMKDYYDAAVYSLDFSKPEALQTINGWCSAKTHALIPAILDKVNPEAVAYLLNAIYFKAEWTDKFSKDDTYGETFITNAGTPDFSTIEMMHKTAKALYCESEGMKALNLPFGGGRYSMTFLLPESVGGLDALKSQLSGKTVQELKFTEQEVEMALPVFATEADTDLIPLLKELGVSKMFSLDAELKGIAQYQNGKDMPLYVSVMKQKTRLGVDEEGCEGTAVTKAELMETSNIPDDQPQPKTFLATHPFVYAVTEQATGAVVFMGQFCGE